MAKVMTVEQMLQLAEGTDPFLAGIENLVDTCKFHRQIVSAAPGALFAATEFFNVARLPGVCNLEKINQVAYPLWITGVGVQAFGDGVDVAIAIDRSQVVITKDNRGYAPLPSNILCGGGGITMQYSALAAGAPVVFATNGLGNEFFALPTPIAFFPEQILNVALETDGSATLVGGVNVSIMLRGVESRPVR